MFVGPGDAPPGRAPEPRNIALPIALGEPRNHVRGSRVAVTPPIWRIYAESAGVTDGLEPATFS